jgi:hypothetical protein
MANCDFLCSSQLWVLLRMSSALPTQHPQGPRELSINLPRRASCEGRQVSSLARQSLCRARTVLRSMVQVVSLVVLKRGRG